MGNRCHTHRVTHVNKLVAHCTMPKFSDPLSWLFTVETSFAWSWSVMIQCTYAFLITGVWLMPGKHLICFQCYPILSNISRKFFFSLWVCQCEEVCKARMCASFCCRFLASPFITGHFPAVGMLKKSASASRQTLIFSVSCSNTRSR